MRKQWVFSLICGVLALSVRGQELDYFIEKSIENYPEIKAANAALNAASKAEGQVSFLEDPTISAGYNVLSSGMTDAEVSLMQNFSWFGTAKHQKILAQATTKAGEHMLYVKKNALALEVSQLYYELWKIDENLKVWADISENLRRLEELASDKLAVSKGTMVNVLRVQLAEDKIAVKIKAGKRQRASLVFELNNYTSRAPEEQVIVEPPENPINLLETREKSKHEEVQVLETKLEQDKAALKVAKKETMPKIGVGVNYMKMKPKGNELMPMLSFSLPVFRKKYKAKFEELEWQQEQTKQERKVRIKELEREHNRVQSDIEQTQMELELLARQIEVITSAKDLELTRYTTSEGDFKTILELNQEELDFEIEKIEKNAQLYKLWKQWEYLNPKN